MTKARVAVAMSGGIDSSVAAYLLIKEGFEVAGITHQIWLPDESAAADSSGVGIIKTASRVAATLGIPHYVIDLRNEFIQDVIVPFCETYQSGKTPNPCVLCNRHIRFGVLLEKIRSMGFYYLATGHYAGITSSDGHVYRLVKARDSAKDQSYFLYTLGQSQLKNIQFPLWNYQKTDVRKIALEKGLPSTERKESQDICFISGDYRNFIKRFIIMKPGDITDIAGNILGRHNGLPLYTVGQRHGSGISSSEPLYVLKLDTRNNRLVLGPRKYLYSKELVASDLNWVSGTQPDSSFEITARVRYRAKEAPANVIPNGDKARVVFKEPQFAVTPGQSVVFYDKDVVLGGGIIIEVLMDYAVT